MHFSQCGCEKKRREREEETMPSGSKILSGSILSADMCSLGEEVEKFERAHGDWVHVDVMDGCFVPNITVGVPVVAALKKRSRLPLDVHLMIEDPDRFVPDFVQAGASVLTVQVEACLHLYRTLEKIRSFGVKAGVALNPATPLSTVEHVLTKVDLVLIMTVEPGFGGQSFIPAMLPKIATLAEMVRRLQLAVDIEVDGGINTTTIGEAAKAGANVFVSGDYVFRSGDISRSVQALRAALP
jgi:ribulose-phosphate 3-epimerase